MLTLDSLLMSSFSGKTEVPLSVSSTQGLHFLLLQSIPLERKNTHTRRPFVHYPCALCVCDMSISMELMFPDWKDREVFDCLERLESLSDDVKVLELERGSGMSDEASNLLPSCHHFDGQHQNKEGIEYRQWKGKQEQTSVKIKESSHFCLDRSVVTISLFLWK